MIAAAWAFLGPLLYLTGLTGTLLYVFKKRFNFQYLLPVAIIGATLFVYFSTFLTHRITIGVIVTVVVALALIPLLVRDKHRTDLLRNLLFTPGYIVFVVLYAVLFTLHYNWVPQIFSDDLMHWAPHVWTMWARDDFYTSPGLSIVTHGDYQPILQLYQLMFSKVAGMYREGLLYVALEITCFAMLLPLLKDLNWQKKRTWATMCFSLLAVVALLILPTLIDVTHLFYNALHPDYAIAFVFLFSLFVAVSESRAFTWRGAALLSFAVTFLCLTKQSSILFGGLSVAVYVTGLWLNRRPAPRVLLAKLLRYMKRWRMTWHRIALSLLLLALPLIGLKLWQVQIKGFSAPYCCVAIFHISPTDTFKVPGVLLGQSGNKSQQEYARNFARYVITYQAGFTTQLLTGVTYVQFTLLFVGAMIFIGYNYRDKFRRSRFIAFTVILLAGWVGYSFAIYLTFLFGGMIDSERDNLLVGDRYLRTYVFALLLVLFALLVTYLVRSFNDRRRSVRTLVIFIGIVVVVTGLLFNIDLVKNGQLIEKNRFVGEYTAQGIADPMALTKRVRSFAASTGATYLNPKKVAYTELSRRQTAYLFRYLMLPNTIANGNDLMLDSDIGADDVCKVLERSNFLFIEHAFGAKAFAKVNECLSTPIDTPALYDAFKVERDGESIRLTKWNY